MRKWAFDNIVREIVKPIPIIGKPLWKYYVKHSWFSRTSKYIVTTAVLFWLVKSPMIWLLNGFLPSLNLLVLVIPPYLLAAFFTGIIITVIGVVLNEIWIYRR
jgi:hypothetical protein